ncbi:MAG: peptide chain release factor N(5)-glutamine methyltransferase [Bacteroidetes bacterium]|nr:MAG: peptide chain release factor N(5)-glutamine methyltransferase [Bacteroidota bacterium]
MTIADALARLTETLTPIYGSGETRSLVRIVAEDVFGTSNLQHSKVLSDTDEAYFSEIHMQLLSGKPLQYVLGKADFYGYVFHVNEHVLIPRLDTEELVHLILESLPKNEGLSGLDIGTGSGCIPIVLKKKRPNWDVQALDVSREALIVAQKNAQDLSAELTFHQLDILNKKEWPNLPVFDFIVSNPPYIPEKEKDLVPRFVKEFEPGLALFVEDEDPLKFYRTIADFAQTHLSPGGQLFYETNEFNADKVVEMLNEKGFTNVESIKDMSGKDRMVSASFSNQFIG